MKSPYDVWPPLEFYNPPCECGGTYRQRTYEVKYGWWQGCYRTFWGCSNYPRCRNSMSEREGREKRDLSMPWDHPWFHGYAICYHGDGRVTNALTGQPL